MTMTFFLHESIQPNAPLDLIERGAADRRPRTRLTGEFPLLREKLRVPKLGRVLERERPRVMLEKSMAQFPATLLSGRAGTGKTVLAADLASRVTKVAWYTVQTADLDWLIFSRYLSQCLENAGSGATGPLPERVGGSSQPEIAGFLARHFLKAERPRPEKTLIVLDDAHHIFDVPWFEEFFKLLLYSLPVNAHLLMLCRSKPPSPLWRLRSKQVLNVIEEDQLAFTPTETAELFQMLNCTLDPDSACEEAFGRVGRLVEFASTGSDT